MERFKALYLAMAVVMGISSLTGCSRADEPAPVTTAETTAEQTKTTTAAAQGAVPEGTSEAETSIEEKGKRKKPFYD